MRQEFGGGPYDLDRFCSWNCIEKCPLAGRSVVLLCLSYACFGCQYGLVGLQEEQYRAAAASCVPLSPFYYGGHAMLRKRKGAHQTPITKDTWEAYLHEHFCAPSNSCPPPHRAAAEGSCPESHTGNVESTTAWRVYGNQFHRSSSKVFTHLDTWEQGSMGRCPESAIAGHRGVWGTINRGVQSFMGAVRGIAQRDAACWTGNSGASARDMAVPLGRNHPPPEVLFQQGAQNR